MGDEDCKFCPDGHEKPWKANWGSYVDVYKDGDGQPTIISVMKTGSQHVADSDAEWINEKLRGQHTPEEMLDWLDWMADDLADHLPGLDAIAVVLREQIVAALMAKAGTAKERERLKRAVKSSRFSGTYGASGGKPGAAASVGGTTTGRLTRGESVIANYAAKDADITKKLVEEMTRANRIRYGRD